MHQNIFGLWSNVKLTIVGLNHLNRPKSLNKLDFVQLGIEVHDVGEDDVMCDYISSSVDLQFNTWEYISMFHSVICYHETS